MTVIGCDSRTIHRRTTRLYLITGNISRRENLRVLCVSHTKKNRGRKRDDENESGSVTDFQGKGVDEELLPT